MKNIHGNENTFDVNVQRIYFIDEAHRDYKFDGSFLARLMKSDSNAFMIALTGTPLIGELKTRDIFGKYIHTYPLRLIREGIKTEYRLKLKNILSGLDKEISKNIFANTGTNVSIIFLDKSEN